MWVGLWLIFITCKRDNVCGTVEWMEDGVEVVVVVNKFRGSGSGFCPPPLHAHTEVTHNHVLLFVLLLFTYNMLPGKTNGARKEVMQTHDSDTKKGNGN